MKRVSATLFIRFVLLLSFLFSGVLQAGEADVIEVKIQHNGGNSFQINTTVAHGDTGWNHYANGWEVLDESGEVIGKRTLHHPHENEQPFTRGLRLSIPEGIKKITVRALDLVHGAGGKTVTVALPR